MAYHPSSRIATPRLIATPMKTRLFPRRLRDQRRGNLWANTVGAVAVGGVFLIAGGPGAVLKPWNDFVKSGVAPEEILASNSEEEDVAAKPLQAYHTYFALELEESQEEEMPSTDLAVEGDWRYPDDGSDCSTRPELSITLRESDSAVFGYGLAAPSACGTHAAEELDYAVVRGTHEDGYVVLTIISNAHGHPLYQFEGTLSDEGLVGRLASVDGAAIADGLVFLPDAEGHL